MAMVRGVAGGQLKGYIKDKKWLEVDNSLGGCTIDCSFIMHHKCTLSSGGRF